MAEGTEEPERGAGSVQPVRRRRSLQQEPKPSLQPVLLSGRSLEGPPRTVRTRLRERRALLGVVALVLVVVLLAVLGKQHAERTADAALELRAAELAEVLEGSTPEDFLAFAVGVQRPDSVARAVRDLDGFVNLRATVDFTFMRFQPSGWWAGFTERCLVAVLRDEGATITAPKTNCNRVAEPDP